MLGIVGKIMAKYNRFIKCKSLNIKTGYLEDVIININNIDSIFPSKVVDDGDRFDVVFLRNRSDPYYISSNLKLLDKLQRLGDTICEI